MITSCLTSIKQHYIYLHDEMKLANIDKWCKYKVDLGWTYLWVIRYWLSILISLVLLLPKL